MCVKSTIPRSSLSTTTGADLQIKEQCTQAVTLQQTSTYMQNGIECLGDVFIEEKENKTANMEVFELRYFEASLFATVIEDVITALRVLDECNNELRIIKAMADMGLLLALKYNVKQPTIIDDLEGIEKHQLDKMEYQLNKLDADRKFIAESLTKTYTNLSLNRNWKPLADVVNQIVYNDLHINYIVGEEIKNKLCRRDLMRQYRQQCNHIKSVIYENDRIIERLRTQVEDAALNAEVRSRYMENWQLARSEQHLQRIIDKEAGPTEVIEYYKERADQEQRVHNEIDIIINMAITESLEEVDNWMNKYDKDMEAIDLKIQIRKLDYQNMLEKREELEDTIAKHQDLINNWINFKEEREEARQYREKMHKAAITVQSWWRGLLVRLEIGPYKPTRKKPAPPPEPKKKKK